jgi:ATPase subunit of ABC transporter with duplicated ATPase domains
MPGQLALRHISVSLAGRSMLRHVSLIVRPAARIGLLGPNGVGKSTLLRTAAGLVAPGEGSVARAPHDASVGYLEQEPLAVAS